MPQTGYQIILLLFIARLVSQQITSTKQEKQERVQGRTQKSNWNELYLIL